MTVHDLRGGTIATVTGGREHTVTPAEARAWRGLLAQHGVAKVRHGVARGVDQWCALDAADLGLVVEAWPADWKAHGRSAGPRRNVAMLRGGVQGTAFANLLIAFPGGSGTAHCCSVARGLWIPVIEIERVVAQVHP